MLGAGLAALTAVGASVLAAPSAQAASLPSLTSTTCGTVHMDARAYKGADLDLVLDGGPMYTVHTGDRGYGTPGLLGGRYAYIYYLKGTNKAVGAGVVKVAACKGSRMRTVEGDADGDGRADVFGVTQGGALIYYHMAPAGLQTVKTVFPSGFATTTWIQRVTEVGSDTDVQGPNYLFAARSDGTLWRYLDHGNGNLGAAEQVTGDLSGYSHFMITQSNNKLWFGGHRLYAAKDSTLFHWTGLETGALSAAQKVNDGWQGLTAQIALKDMNGDGFADVANVVNGVLTVELITYNSDVQVPQGPGWGAMQIIASPGDVTGDGLSDLIARRSDGNLYRYASTGKGFGPAVQIGRNWGGITCLG